MAPRSSTRYACIHLHRWQPRPSLDCFVAARPAPVGGLRGDGDAASGVRGWAASPAPLPPPRRLSLIKKPVPYASRVGERRRHGSEKRWFCWDFSCTPSDSPLTCLLLYRH